MIVHGIAALLVLVALVWGSVQYAILLQCDVSLGRVTELPASRGNKGGTVYGIVAQYTDRHGQPQRYASSWKSTHPGYQIGDPIPIYNSPDNPSRNGICTFTMCFGIPWILFVVACGLEAVVLGWRVGDSLLAILFPPMM